MSMRPETGQINKAKKIAGKAGGFHYEPFNEVDCIQYTKAPNLVSQIFIARRHESKEIRVEKMRIIFMVLCLFAIAICFGTVNVEIGCGEGLDRPEQRYVRIGHYQCRCRQGDYDANFKTVLKGLKLAAESKLDIVSFPESILTGYFQSEETARANSFAVDSPQIGRLLAETSSFDIVFMVGFNERREKELYNTVVIVEKGKVLGRYSKAMPCSSYFTPGRDFPVFEKKGLKFGVVICADGGYIEPTRILALKGAKLIFAPHYNYVSRPVPHYEVVRNDHIARAVENGVYFLRGNTIDSSKDVEGLLEDGHGYGDSYLLNPNGEKVAAAGLYHEYLMVYNLDLQQRFYSRHADRSRKSSEDLGDILLRSVNSAKARIYSK